MKKVLLLFFVFVENWCLGQVTWEKKISNSNLDSKAFSIAETRDRGFCVAGSITYGSSHPNAYILKTDSNVNLLWTRILIDGTEGCASSIIQDKDDGYSVCGYYLNGSVTDVRYLKLDLNGNIIAQNLIEDINHGSRGIKIIETSDLGHAICGYSATGIYVIKLNLNHTIEWSRQILAGDWANDIIETTDVGYLVCGVTAYGAGGRDFCVIKLDSAGIIQWAKSIGDSTWEESFSAVETLDGGFAVCGESSGSNGTDGVYLIKLDINGNLLWTKCYSNTGKVFGRKILQLANGDLVMYVKKVSGITYDALLKTDTYGNLIWSKEVASAGYSEGSIYQTHDGGFVIGTTMWDGLNSQIIVTKFDSIGNTCDVLPATWTVTTHGVEDTIPKTVWGTDTSRSLPSNIFSSGTVSSICGNLSINKLSTFNSPFSIYPNPTHSAFTVQLTVDSGQLTVFDITGRCVYRQAIISPKSEIRNSFSPGIYFVKVYTGEKVYEQKLVVK